MADPQEIPGTDHPSAAGGDPTDAEPPAGGPAGGGAAPPPGGGDDAASTPDPHDRRILGVKLHNLIFVGLFLGVVLGLITYGLEHFDRVVLEPDAELSDIDLHEEELEALPRDDEGRIVIHGDATQDDGTWYVQTPGGREAKVPDDRVAEHIEPDRALYDGLVWWFNLFGKVIFLGALKMLIAPLIFASIVAGICSLTGLDQLKRIGVKTLLYYCCTTLIAVGLGLVAVLVIAPGEQEASQLPKRLRQAQIERYADTYQEETGEPAWTNEAEDEPTDDFLAYLRRESARAAGTGHQAERFGRLESAEEVSGWDILRDQLISPMLTNPFKSLTEAKSLGIIFFAVLFGVFTVLTGTKGRPVADFFLSFNEVIIAITKWLMSFAPFFVMCLVAEIIAKSGPNVFGSLAWYCITVIGGIVLHVGVLLTIAYMIAGVTPRRLWQGIGEAWLIAFSTRSSAGTLPVTMRCVTEKLGVSPRVANFALPVGATMNMDGTALYEGVAVIFLLQVFGALPDVPIELTALATFVIFITAVLASIGAAAVPDAGLVTMVLVATAVGLPVYYIPLIFAVDAFLDMFRTSTNVLGDSVGCLVIQRFEDGGVPAAAPS